tara:strand:+ start:172 stop:495 length:324 start_codon:yes stop_codon:yes gene_type:complete
MEKIDYVFVEKDDTDFTSIKLTSGEFKNVIYTYGKVTVREPEGEGGTAQLTFDFKVEEIPPILEMTKEELGEDLGFKNHIGNLLTQILEDSLEEYEGPPKDNSPVSN